MTENNQYLKSVHTYQFNTMVNRKIYKELEYQLVDRKT